MGKVNQIEIDKCPYCYWSKVEIMNYIQRRVIVYSIMYYEMNESCVSDSYYDELSNQLVKLMKEYPTEAKETTYYYVFYDFDGSTGFDIPSRLTKQDLEYLTQVASRIHYQWVLDNQIK